MDVNDKIFLEILLELRRFIKFNEERIASDDEIREAIIQMRDYLKEHQAIIIYSLKDISKNNERTMREIKSLYSRISILSNPELSGLSRINNKLISSDSEPVYVLNKSIQTRMAETSLNPTQPNNAAYYRIGFYTNLPTSYTTIDDGYPTLVNTAQILRVASTSTSDTSGGTGTQQVLVGGIDANNNRFFETITLNGTTPVTTTNQFSQLYIINSVAVGSAGSAVGTISVTNTGFTTTFGAIQPGENAWRSGRIFTDKNATGYIYQWSIASYNAAVRFHLRVNHIEGNYQALVSRSMGICDNSTTDFNFHHRGCICLRISGCLHQRNRCKHR